MNETESEAKLVEISKESAVARRLEDVIIQLVLWIKYWVYNFEDWAQTVIRRTASVENREVIRYPSMGSLLRNWILSVISSDELDINWNVFDGLIK